MEHRLLVATNTEHVGHIGFDAAQDQYTFHYTHEWPGRESAFPLSPHIPLSGEVPRSGVLHRFLANLLPEGRALEIASVMYQMSKDNIFGLVRMLGKEPVGALSFLAEAPRGEGAGGIGAAEAEPAEPAEPAIAIELEPIRREISDEELSARIRERDSGVPFPVWDGKVRLSVAGYQDKLQVLVEDERLYLVDGSLSSTHILKPETRNAHTPFMVANEHFCMTFAARLGLPVAPVTLRRTPEPILLIERFDRVVVPSQENPQEALRVLRRHIIDGCQALDLPVTFKYERNFGNTPDVRNIREGVSFEKLFSLTPHLDNPAAARTYMVRWALLQLLIGNSDAHGKNFSFFVREAGIEPTPMYDLVSVNVYGEAVEQEMAMGYGDEFRIEQVTAYALADFAQRTGTRRSLLAREMQRMANAALKLAPELAREALYTDDERELVQRVSDFVCGQAGLFLKLAPMVPKVDTKLL
ncbi:HipA domain-containing protein [Caballeronia novacaledonica]|uniref:HipA domain-containing protein n=1 Tax=Caballeronia novacaledonica TaxID=1544861 RepID=UPI001EE20AF0|nr:HipA domain-containing protein [Caballeronia novacaledonica]GJH14592.1 HipA domain-containing protein [Caballeronia novacaledonica]